jgi:outer membrane protein TolC
LDEAAIVRLAIEHHPALAVASSRADVAAHEARVAYSAKAPTVGIGGTYAREGTGDRIWTGVLVFPLPVGDFGAFDRARQEAVAARSRAEVGVVEQQIARDVYVALHERKHSREAYRALVSGAREPLREALRIARLQYEAGPGDLSSVLLARQRLLAAEEQVAQAAATVQRADIRLQLAAGTLLRPRKP